MPKVTRTICGSEYTFDNIRIGDARRLKQDNQNPSDYNVAFIAASLRAGGHAQATPDWVDNLPFFGDGGFNDMLRAANEACGFNVEEPKAGEAQPAEEPAAAAASTSATSTEV